MSEHYTIPERIALGKKVYERDKEKETIEALAKRLDIVPSQAYAYQKLYKDSIGAPQGRNKQNGSAHAPKKAAPKSKDTGAREGRMAVVDMIEAMIIEHVRLGGGPMVVATFDHVCTVMPRK